MGEIEEMGNDMGDTGEKLHSPWDWETVLLGMGFEKNESWEMGN